MRNDIFIETDNVTEFDTKIRTLEDTENGEPGFALVHGQAGRGKTETARHYYVANGGIYLRVMQGWTQAAFLSELCYTICKIRPRSSSVSKNNIIKLLDQESQTIFIDEADRLNVDRIEDLRDIHDMTGVSVVLIGEDELPGLLGERRRIWSRVKQEIKFAPVSNEDVAILGDEACDLEIVPAACDLIVHRSDGDFRLVRTLLSHLEKAAKARQTNSVTVSMVTDVAKTAIGWRRV